MKNLIVKHYSGSISYGTNIPTSDVDIRGIFCADPEFYRTPFYTMGEQKGKGEDEKYFEISKFLQLYTQGNPNIIESLWVDKSDIIETTPAYDLLLENREKLLSRKVAFSFSGYAISQLKRIRGHNKWINKPESIEPPKHKDYVKMIQNFTHDKIMPNDFDVSKYAYEYGLMHYSDNIFGIVKDYQLPRVFDKNGDFNISSKNVEVQKSKLQPSFIIKFNAEEYNKAKDNWHNYWHWKENRNTARSALEENFGYDTKHAMHLVRLLRMAEEILTGQGVNVKRSDADELLAIRAGSMKYSDLVEWAEAKDNYIHKELYNNCLLPKSPDIKLASKLLIQIQDMYG